MNAPKVTIAIVFYNAMPYLPWAITSCLNQSYRDFELVLLDDGSTDDSLSYVRSLQDPRIRIFSDGLNLKLNVRLNQAVKLARGEFFFRMDGDDIMMPHRLENQLRLLDGAAPNTVVGGGAVSIDNNNKIVGIRRSGRTPVTDYQARHSFIHPTVAARRTWFLENPYSESFVFHRSQDAELWVRTWRQSVFIPDPRPVLFYREDGRISIENYIATAFGLVVMAYRNPRLTPFRKSAWAALELGKAWTVMTLAMMDRTNILVRRRQSALNESELIEHQKVLVASLADPRSQ